MPGPAPKSNSQRRRRNAPRANTVKLPAEGRQGPAPQWPLSKTFEPDRWQEIWRLPQAVMWEKMHAEMIVARYVDLQDRVSDPGLAVAGTSAFWSELRQLEDRLGLTPMAMMKLQWEIAGTTETDDDAPESEKADGQADIIHLQERAGFGSE